VGLSHLEIIAQVITAYSIDDDVISGVAAHGGEILARLDLLQRLHRRCGCAGRSERALGKNRGQRTENREQNNKRLPRLPARENFRSSPVKVGNQRRAMMGCFHRRFAVFEFENLIADLWSLIDLNR